MSESKWKIREFVILRFTWVPHIKLTSDNLTQMKDSQAKEDHKKGSWVSMHIEHSADSTQKTLQ